MKKVMIVMAMIMSLALVLAACTQTIVDPITPASDVNTMDDSKEMTADDDMMEDKSMEDEKDMEGDKDMMEEEDMDDSSKMTNDGAMAPAFEYTDFDGNAVTLADFKGEKLYVKYWASWCSICVSGLPELDQLAGEDNGFKVITVVTPDYKGERDMADFKAWFADKETENIVVLFDEGGDYAKEFGIRGYPTSVYIGSDSVLIKAIPGHASNEMVKEAFGMIH